MRLTNSLLALLLIYASVGNSMELSGRTKKLPRTNRIVGGVAAVAGEIPYIVSLKRSWGHFCGGSLIDKNWVLTAAHCVRSGGSGLKVRIGLLAQSDTEGVEVFSAAKVILHPEYNDSTNDYDLALIKLSGESKFPPVKLNDAKLSIPDEEENAPWSTTAGWGTTAEGGSVSSKLLKVDVPLVSEKNCDIAYPGEITKSMICAGFIEGGKDSCQGDSGGPLVTQTESDETLLVGVVSWGEGCARPKKYGVYADVYSSIDWISSQLSAP